MKTCELCGERGTRDDPVVEYYGDRHAHIGCAEDEGWEE